MSFRIRGLQPAQFEPLFALDDTALSERHMRRMNVDEPESVPCRITLDFAKTGERVILLPFAHQMASSPYRASGPIFVREGQRAPFDRIDELPAVFAGRLLSVRGYDADGMMIHADVAKSDPTPLFTQFFADPRTETLHVHNAWRGCYSCRVERA